ncbi:uncharacterized protein [Littorina saxatilis]|uniref:uncharacterized protein n=1 Tax=Littorina saxatilis TaxID=31220 RepID=UPI0038B5169A
MRFATSLAVFFFIYLQLINACDSDLFALQTKGTSGFVFTQYLLFSSDQGSAGTCALKCFRTASCLSFTFTGVKEPGNCRGHDQIMVHSDGKLPAAAARSFAFPYKGVWRMKSCMSVADCGPVTNVMCFRNLCVCTAAFPIYSESLNQCISDCPDSSLSSNFMLYLDAGIDYNNLGDLENTTEDECKAACVQSTSFTCRNVEWQDSNGLCHPQNVTARTSFDTENSAGWKFWQRHCQ